VNKKLVQRSEKILRELSGRSRVEVREALQRAQGSVKLALLLLEGCDINEATSTLERTGGQLRAAKALIDTGRNAKRRG
jgi:N-acetylmuramic acid 6-phosphate etherase